MHRMDGSVLLVERLDPVSGGFVWDIPGGEVPHKVDDFAAALHATEHSLGTLPPLIRAGSDMEEGQEVVFTTFTVFAEGQDTKRWTPTLEDALRSWGWFPRNSLPHPIHPAVLERL